MNNIKLNVYKKTSENYIAYLSKKVEAIKIAIINSDDPIIIRILDREYSSVYSLLKKSLGLYNVGLYQVLRIVALNEYGKEGLIDGVLNVEKSYEAELQNARDESFRRLADEIMQKAFSHSTRIVVTSDDVKRRTAKENALKKDYQGEIDLIKAIFENANIKKDESVTTKSNKTDKKTKTKEETLNEAEALFNELQKILDDAKKENVAKPASSTSTKGGKKRV